MNYFRVREMNDRALADNVKYFSKKYADFSAERCLERVQIIISALGGGPRTVEWAQTLPIAEILLANNEQGLRMCFNYDKNPMRMPWKAFAQILKIPGVAEHLAECILSSSGMFTMEYYRGEMKKWTGYDFRAYLLARNGAALHVVKNYMVMKSLIKRYKLSKSDLASAGIPWPRSLK